MARTTKVLVALMALLALTAACGGGDDDDEGVASLADSAADDAGDGAGDGDDVRSDEEAALEFSTCMRDGGVEGFPDPDVLQDGSITFPVEELLGIDLQSSAVGDSFVSCFPLIRGVTFGGALGTALTEFQDTVVEHAECLRDEGLDVGDIDVGGGDVLDSGSLDPDADRMELIAGVYGVDPDDPEVLAALEACDPILSGAFGGTG